MQGLLLLNKPKGITSFKAVATIKRLAKEKRVGHTGTLDPIAEGVLPIFLGRATSLSGLLLGADKTYTATARLGISTDTLDITGTVLNRSEFKRTVDEVREVLSNFVGETDQIPPMYSALKKDGVRLYELAREGKTAEIEPRKVTIHNIELISFKDNEFKFTVTCSKGTYIRSLIRDIGEKLGCGATMTALERTSTSGFDISECVSLDELSEENIKDYILPEERALAHYKEIKVSQKQAIRFSNGGQLSYERLKNANFADGELLRVKYDDVLLGLGFADNEKQQVAIKCILATGGL